MKYITLPPPITLTDLKGEVLKDKNGDPQTMSGTDFILSRLVDESFGRDGMAGVLSTIQIRKAVEDAKGCVVAIESADWDRLAAATKKPSGGYNTAISHALVPFMNAILNATDKPPEPEAPCSTS